MLESSGVISLGGSTIGRSVNLELAKASDALISLNDTAVRVLANKPSGIITLSDLYGANQFESSLIEEDKYDTYINFDDREYYRSGVSGDYRGSMSPRYYDDKLGFRHTIRKFTTNSNKYTSVSCDTWFAPGDPFFRDKPSLYGIICDGVIYPIYDFQGGCKPIDAEHPDWRQLVSTYLFDGTIPTTYGEESMREITWMTSTPPFEEWRP